MWGSALDLWEVLFGQSVPIQFHEDNTAMVAIMKSGRNARMRHLNRTHGISMEWLLAEFERGRFVIQAIPSDSQAADIFTKAFMQAVKWKQNRVLMNHFSPE